MLDVTDRQIVIIGGGAVAARKVSGLLEAGATRIRVIAIAFSATFPTRIERVQRPYDSVDLNDADLVFSATDSVAVNDAVVHEAQAKGIWVCRADSSEAAAGDFLTPAKFQSGPITVTVSAGSAALSAMIRDGLAECFDPAWSEMADAMKKLRPIIKVGEADPIRRAELFRALATPKALKVLREHGIDGLKDWISQQ
jgi:precorrin-2 dehydrogenase/sirohydrochlorin ferrochelatase